MYEVLVICDQRGGKCMPIGRYIAKFIGNFVWGLTLEVL